ncbi:CcdB family protein [Caballeronia sp. GAFFF1]|uniref:CcdB family protein n=1 Tax=Caballeronia sp. GAFFF1 TaxID=2921779 RepID=UPI002027CDA1|nr:CcdB family protein [Caballeronia sp. GAFFF1]
MARFDIFAGPSGHASTPYVVEVQGHHLSGLATRVVIPLRRLDRLAPVPLLPDLIPVFVIEGIECMLDTPTLAAVRAAH